MCWTWLCMAYRWHPLLPVVVLVSSSSAKPRFWLCLPVCAGASSLGSILREHAIAHSMSNQPVLIKHTSRSSHQVLASDNIYNITVLPASVGSGVGFKKPHKNCYTPIADSSLFYHGCKSLYPIMDARSFSVESCAVECCQNCLP